MGSLRELLRGGGVDLLLLVGGAVEHVPDGVDDSSVGAVDVAGRQIQLRRGDLRLGEVDGGGGAGVVDGHGSGGQVAQVDGGADVPDGHEQDAPACEERRHVIHAVLDVDDHLV